MKNNGIIRKPLLNVTLNSKIVTSVDVREIAFAASQKTGLHKHLHSGKFHARKPTRKTGFAHVLEHLSHLRVLA